jgi:mRNA-degrading endonuclease RelE of RelBE toxin-antitoxin system
VATVRITAEAAKEFEKLPAKIQDRVSIVLVRLEKWPMVSGSKPLRGKLAGHCRIRTGDYRIQFYIVGDVVTVEKIGHRDGFYDD